MSEAQPLQYNRSEEKLIIFFLERDNESMDREDIIKARKGEKPKDPDYTIQCLIDKGVMTFDKVQLKKKYKINEDSSVFISLCKYFFNHEDITKKFRFHQSPYVQRNINIKFIRDVFDQRIGYYPIKISSNELKHSIDRLKNTWFDKFPEIDFFFFDEGVYQTVLIPMGEDSYESRFKRFNPALTYYFEYFHLLHEIRAIRTHLNDYNDLLIDMKVLCMLSPTAMKFFLFDDIFGNLNGINNNQSEFRLMNDINKIIMPNYYGSGFLTPETMVIHALQDLIKWGRISEYSEIEEVGIMMDPSDGKELNRLIVISMKNGKKYQLSFSFALNSNGMKFCR